MLLKNTPLLFPDLFRVAVAMYQLQKQKKNIKANAINSAVTVK